MWCTERRQFLEACMLYSKDTVDLTTEYWQGSVQIFWNPLQWKWTKKKHRSKEGLFFPPIFDNCFYSYNHCEADHKVKTEGTHTQAKRDETRREEVWVWCQIKSQRQGTRRIWRRQGRITPNKKNAKWCDTHGTKNKTRATSKGADWLDTPVHFGNCAGVFLMCIYLKWYVSWLYIKAINYCNCGKRMSC